MELFVGDLSFEDTVNKIVEIGKQSTLSEEDIEFLRGVIKLRKKLELTFGNGPHSLSPEDMVTSLSIQVLMKYTGSKYINEIRTHLENSDNPSALRSMVRYMEMQNNENRI